MAQLSGSEQPMYVFDTIIRVIVYLVGRNTVQISPNKID